MNDSAFFHKKKEPNQGLFKHFKEHQERIKKFEKMFPEKSVMGFCNWYCDQKGINLKSCSSNDLVNNVRIALMALEDANWDYKKLSKDIRT